MATSNGNKIRKIKVLTKQALMELMGPSNMALIGRETATIVRRRTRLGFGVAKNGGNPEKLKPLSTSYIEQRRGKLAFYTRSDGKVIPYKPKKPKKLSGKTTPTKSNLTFSAELLDSLKERVTGLGKVEIRPTGTRRDGLSNAEVAEYVSEERPFLNLSKNEIKQIENMANDQLVNIVNKKLTKL